MPLQATSGAASYDAFGGGVPVAVNYIEDVFSTYLYAGTDANQAINNGVDLSGKGGMLWLKARDQNTPVVVFDTNRGASPTNSQMLWTASNDFNFPTSSNALNSFNSTGFTLGADDTNWVNFTSINFVSWTFRKQPKFFDVVTFTSAASGSTTFSHNLGSTPGCVFIKSTQSASDWYVYHRIVGNDAFMVLNSDAVANAVTGCFSVSSTSVTINSAIMAASESYVAYVFAHDAGGFGLTGTDNVISCGSYTGTFTAGLEVELGYEPQWVMIKRRSSVTGNWFLFDNMRGMPNGSADAYLYANTSDAEASFEYIAPTATGFKIDSTTGGLNASGGSYIYIAIRRGPMKVPTVGTSVFNTLAHTGDAGGIEVTGVGFPPDLLISKCRQSQEGVFLDRLRGTGRTLFSNGTSAEDDNSFYIGALGQDGVKTTTAQNAIYNRTGFTNAWWFMKRAPSFFDEVCYTGTGSAITIPHNLTVKPEFIIQKCRSTLDNWHTFTALDGWARLNSANAWADTASGSGINTIWQATTTTVALNSTFAPNFGASASTYVIYLFATCAGVSKVGSYTGNGTTQTINCGFGAGGARFVLIKRSDSTGGWYVYDTARGMTVMTDPYLFLNNNAGEVATLGSVTTVSTGFALDSTILAAINESGGNYIFLAIA